MLIETYRSESQTHSYYIIALMIGCLTLISRFDSFLTNDASSSLSTKLVFYFFLSAISGLTVYFIGRLSYWSALSELTKRLTDEQYKTYASNDYDQMHTICILEDCIQSKLEEHFKFRGIFREYNYLNLSLFVSLFYLFSVLLLFSDQIQLIIIVLCWALFSSSLILIKESRKAKIAFI